MTLELTDEQFAWVNKLAAAAGVPGLALLEDEDGGLDEYGEAYTELDTRGAPAALVSGNMPSTAKWGEVATELTADARTVLDDFTTKRAAIEVKVQKRATDAAQYVVAKGTYDTLLTELTTTQTPPLTALQRNQKIAQYRVAKQQVDDYDSLAREITAACLPVVDAPGSNPERNKIDANLTKLNALQAKIGTPFAASVSATDREKQTKERMAEKGALLNDMSRDIAEWMNRRMEAGLPPTREALAMGDIIQQEHQKLIKEYLDKGGDPLPLPPLADQDKMTDEELATAQQTWSALVKDTGTMQFPVTWPVDPNAAPYVKFVDPQPTTKAEAETRLAEYRVEMLAAMARLMGSPSGRDLLAEINEKGADKNKKIHMIPGESPASARLEPAAALATVGVGGDVVPGAGSGAAVMYKEGGTDSYRAYRMDDGNYLYAPTHVTIAHEMVHALHNVEGMNRRDLPLGGIDAMWNNPEEYWTIHKGEISEQTLREDNGLSALRFGHLQREMGDAVNAKALAALEALKEIDDLRKGDTTTPGVDVEDVLRDDRKFTSDQVAAMTDVLKLEIYKDAEAKGPLPDGWEPARLTAAKIKSIVADKLPFRMRMLGWTAYNLEYNGATPLVFGFPKTLKSITESRVHSERSDAGRTFKRLGERAVIDEFAAFKTSTGVDLGSWNSKDWRTNLRALIAADKRVNAMIDGIPAVKADTDPARKVEAKNPLKEKLTRIKAIFLAAFGATDQAEFGALFADDALTHFGYSGDATTDAQVAFLRGKSTGLATSDGELRSAGFDVAAMSLVERDKAAKVLTDFKATAAITGFNTQHAATIKAVSKEDTWDEAVTAYCDVLTHREAAKNWLGANASDVVLAKLKAEFLNKPIIELSEVMGYDALNNAAYQVIEDQAKLLYAGTPSLDEILANQKAEEEFAGFLEATPTGKALIDFYELLLSRDTAAIADAAQGSELVDAGFKRNTAVLLSRDASDSSALTEAMKEAKALLEAKLAAFLVDVKPAG